MFVFDGISCCFADIVVLFRRWKTSASILQKMRRKWSRNQEKSVGWLFCLTFWSAGPCLAVFYPHCYSVTGKKAAFNPHCYSVTGKKAEQAGKKQKSSQPESSQKLNEWDSQSLWVYFRLSVWTAFVGCCRNFEEWRCWLSYQPLQWHFTLNDRASDTPWYSTGYYYGSFVSCFQGQ